MERAYVTSRTDIRRAALLTVVLVSLIAGYATARITDRIAGIEYVRPDVTVTTPAGR